MKKLHACMAALCLAFTAPISAGAASDGPEVTFGIVPQQSASRLARMWGPFLNELGRQTGATFRFRTAKDIPTFEACLAAGAFDFAYMNPMHYTIFSQEAAYRALAHQQGKRLRGVMVARADADITEISSLDGQVIAFPSPGAFGASILNRASLRQADVSFEPSYVKSHDSVYRAVAAGLMPAGGGVTRTWNALDPDVRAQLQIIFETDGFTPHAVAVHEGVDPVFATGVQTALLGMVTSAPDLVQGIGMKGFVSAEDSDWDDVRALGMARDETGITHKGDIECPSG
ncbi:phosphate/phosphite/phosphonate ABC transporter substrate-binding protein [Phaeobacter sp. C3_T13_0]|uniref:phosphate/phosphite/phosphonate ABC transporter substrate-binding protein n=1 Tax=Phaeobacter cretensis TaxID=3342641 RepID=UPI0039BD3775